MQFVGKFLSGVTRIASLFSTLCIVLMMLHVTADVIGRYLFKAPLPGTIVVVGHYYMIIVVFIALGVAEEKRLFGHVEWCPRGLVRRGEANVAGSGLIGRRCPKGPRALQGGGWPGASALLDQAKILPHMTTRLDPSNSPRRVSNKRLERLTRLANGPNHFQRIQRESLQVFFRPPHPSLPLKQVMTFH